MNKKANWKKPVFVDQYKRNLTKAKNYFAKFKSETSDAVKIATYQNRINSFEMMLKMNTGQNPTMPTPTPQPRRASTNTSDNPMAAQIKARQDAMRREWEESQAKIWKSHKDNGTPNPVHQANVGKIRFGNYKYGSGSPNFVSNVKAETPFSYHLFLPNSVQNLAVKEAKATKDRRWLATTSNKLQFVISANGKVMFKWIEVSPDSLVPDTYYTNKVMTAQPINVYGKGGFYAFYMKEVLLKNRSGGTLDIKVDVYLYNLTIRDERKPKVAEGSFKVIYTGADWAKLDRERFVKPETHAYMIPCKHSLYFRTSPNGIKSEYTKRNGTTTLYSKGQKIYVYNPISKQTKYLMTLTTSTQTIVVPMSFCSY